MTADKWTDQELKKLEIRIAKEYKQAEKELAQKAQDYFREYADRWNREEVYHQAGMLSEDAFGRWFKANRDSSVTDSELKDIYKSHTGKYTDQQFKAWELAQLGRGAHWEDLKNQMSERLAQSALIAQDYINGKLPAIYVKNSNEVAKIAQDSAMEQGITGIRFDLVDEYAVKRLMEGSREVKPYKPIVIDLPKTNRFNYTKLQNALIQGILQGDSIEHLADRFMKVSDMNKASAIRNARTACTGAQNGGKQDRYADLASKGCDVVKMWIATPDERTRDEHMEAWQEYGSEETAIPYDEPFEVGGESLMFPADLSLGASGWNVYNCRCTMRSKVKFKSILSDEMRERANIRLVDDDALNEPNTEPQTQPEKAFEFTPAKTKEEAEEYARQFAENVSYNGISLKNANVINETLTKLTDKYPINKLGEIKHKGGKASASANYRVLNINGKLIAKNDASILFKQSQDDTRWSIENLKRRIEQGGVNKDVLQKSIDNLENKLKFTRWGVNDSYPDQAIQTVITHEYGHIIADQYFGQINHERANPNIALNWSIKEVDKRWDEVYNKAKKEGDIYNISEYGSKNSHEFFAESFCAREMGEKLPDYVNEALEDILKNGILQ